jgi:hypothetical protein
MKNAFISIITRISNLITIKSIVTLALTIVFAILSVRGTITAEVFISIFTVIIGFYFGTQKVDDTNKNITVDDKLETKNDLSVNDK